MPKKKNQKKLNPTCDADLEENDLDNISVVSQCSSASEGSFTPPELLDENMMNNLVSKIENAAMDLMSSRPDTRTACLKNLIRCFQNVYFDLESEPSLTNSLCLSLESVIKRGTEIEKVLTAQLISIITLQLDSDIVESWFKCFHDIFEQFISDKTIKPKIRAAACVAVSVLIWQSPVNIDIQLVKNIMNHMASVFRTACLKGDGKSPVHDEHTCSLQSDAISSWLRILLSIPPSIACEMGETYIVHFVSILQNVNVDLRIASAEALAIIFEYIRDQKNERYTGPYYRQILEQLDDLISDSSKAVSKKDKKKQRSSLRPVLASIRTHESPEISIKFGVEQLLLDTCSLNFMYESLCDVLAHGVHRHLQTNVNLREMFDLGPPIKKSGLSSQDRKESKAHRSYVNQTISKNRSQIRNHNRSKKSDYQNHHDD